jgi:hypothetical protein
MSIEIDRILKLAKKWDGALISLALTLPRTQLAIFRASCKKRPPRVSERKSPALKKCE